MLICRAWITTRNGQRLYARNYGKKAFCFEVSEQEHKNYIAKRKKKNKK